MKKHLLLFLHEEYGYITQYGHSIDGISIFELFINNCSVMRYRQILEEGKYDGYGSEMTREEWSREKNEVIITRSHEYFEDDEEEFKMTFENFRKMIEDWTVLYEKQVPNIYFVFEDDGSVTVKESLDT